MTIEESAGIAIRLTDWQMAVLEELIRDQPPHINQASYDTLRYLIEHAKTITIELMERHHD